jgi:hypothetical protein
MSRRRTAHTLTKEQHMNRTIPLLISAVAGLALGSTALANGRHDEKPHGVDAKAVAAQKNQAVRPATLAVGPRVHDSPLRFVTVKSVQPSARSQDAKSR